MWHQHCNDQIDYRAGDRRRHSKVDRLPFCCRRAFPGDFKWVGASDGFYGFKGDCVIASVGVGCTAGEGAIGLAVGTVAGATIGFGNAELALGGIVAG